MLNLLARISFVALVALPVYAQAETGDAPSAPDRNPFRAKTPATAQQPAAKPVLPGDQPTVAWSDAQVAAAKLDCAKVLSGVTLDYETSAAAERGPLRRSGADPGQVDRRGRDRTPGNHDLCARERGRQLDQQDASASCQGHSRHASRSSCTTPPPIPAATVMAARPRRSASTRSPTRSISPNSCSSSGEKVTVLARLATRGESIRRNHGIGHAPSDCKPHGDRGRGGHSGQGKPRNESLCRDGQSQDQSLCGADGCREDAPSHAARRSHRSPNAVRKPSSRASS